MEGETLSSGVRVGEHGGVPAEGDALPLRQVAGSRGAWGCALPGGDAQLHQRKPSAKSVPSLGIPKTEIPLDVCWLVYSYWKKDIKLEKADVALFFRLKIEQFIS